MCTNPAVSVTAGVVRWIREWVGVAVPEPLREGRAGLARVVCRREVFGSGGRRGARSGLRSAERSWNSGPVGFHPETPAYTVRFPRRRATPPFREIGCWRDESGVRRSRAVCRRGFLERRSCGSCRGGRGRRGVPTVGRDLNKGGDSISISALDALPDGSRLNEGGEVNHEHGKSA